MTWQQRLVEAWTRRDPLACSLLPLSWVYGALVAARRRLYRRGLLLRTQRVGVPVVVIGNVVAGGGGKTPLVIAVVRQMIAWGLRPGVISRGYGRSAEDCRAVTPGATAAEVGDEPLLIAYATQAPVVVASQRIQAARHLLHLHPEVDVLVADDGLQHLALHRDVEICVFDDRGIGNGWLLPAGPLREPWPRAIDLVVQADTVASPQGFSVTRRLAPHALRADGSQVPLDSLAAMAHSGECRLWATAGIARPQSFFAMLRAQGLVLSGTLPLPDHAGMDDFHWPESQDGWLLCTEKDAAKLRVHRPDALAVPLEVALEPAFWDALRDRLHRLLPARGQPGTRI